MSIQKVLFLTFFLGLVPGMYLILGVIWSPPVSFRGHTSAVVDVVASPDCKLLASLSQDGTIKLWDTTTSKELAVFRGTSAAFAPDGKNFASAGWKDSTIRLWEVPTGEQGASLRGHSAGVHSIAFSPDGKTLASGSSDQTVKLWDVASGQQLATYRGHTSTVNPVVFSPDGKILASGSYIPDQTIKLWDVSAGQARATLRGNGWSINCLAFSPDGKTLASGSTTSEIKLWDVSTGANTATFTSCGDGVDRVIFSGDGKFLASLGGGVNSIEIWDIASGKKAASYEKNYRRPRPRLFRYIWDSFPGMFEEYSYYPLCLVFTPDGKMVTFGFDTRDHTTVKMWRAP